MEFQQCSIAGVAYAETVEEGKRGDILPDGSYSGGQHDFATLRKRASSGKGEEADVCREFLTLLAVCHTVIPELKNEKIVYQASSPDEAALVAGAELLGYRFTVSFILLHPIHGP